MLISETRRIKIYTATPEDVTKHAWQRYLSFHHQDDSNVKEQKKQTIIDTIRQSKNNTIFNDESPFKLYSVFSKNGDQYLGWICIHPPKGEVIGDASSNPYDNSAYRCYLSCPFHEGYSEISYDFLDEYQDQGFGYEATDVIQEKIIKPLLNTYPLLAYDFKDKHYLYRPTQLPFKGLEAGISGINGALIGLALKLGLRPISFIDEPQGRNEQPAKSIGNFIFQNPSITLEGMENLLGFAQELKTKLRELSKRPQISTGLENNPGAVNHLKLKIYQDAKQAYFEKDARLAKPLIFSESGKGHTAGREYAAYIEQGSHKEPQQKHTP